MSLTRTSFWNSEGCFRNTQKRLSVICFQVEVKQTSYTRARDLGTKPTIYFSILKYCFKRNLFEHLILFKDYKLAIAEVRVLSRMAVFSRLKQDYATLSSRGGKVTSSYDPRISFTVPRNGINGKDHVIMEVRSRVKR